MNPPQKIPHPLNEVELRQFLDLQHLDEATALRIWCGQIHCQFTTPGRDFLLQHGNHFSGALSGWNITLGRSERIGNRRWLSQKYNIMRCIYKLMEEEGFMNKQWEMFNTRFDYMWLNGKCLIPGLIICAC